MLGIYANLDELGPTWSKSCEWRKLTGWQTVVGGPEPAAYIDEYLEAGADVVVIGEGEVTLEELVPVLRSRATALLDHVADIAFRASDGRIVRRRPESRFDDIDAQPWPAREAIDMSALF